jgi:F0F1-type ATP synthase assembly protein I
VAEDNTDLKQAMFQVSDGVIGAAILIVIGLLGGQWLDKQFHTSPTLMIVLSMIGGGVGLVRLVKKAMLIGADSPKPDPKKMIDLSSQDDNDDS